MEDQTLEERLEYFKQTVEATPAPEIWLAYLSESIKTLPATFTKPEDWKPVRSLFEAALTAVGLDVNEGGRVWASYLQFEKTMLSALQTSQPESSLLAKQQEFIRALFGRVLGVPLTDSEEFLSSYREWEAGLDHRGSSSAPQGFDDRVKRANAKLESIRELEALVEETAGWRGDESRQSEAVARWMQYIEHEKKHGDPGRVCMLFERALRVLSSDASLWVAFVQYLWSLKNWSAALKLCVRATRRLEGVCVLWCMYLQALERAAKPKEDVEVVLNEALSTTMDSPADYYQIWLNVCLFYRRSFVAGQDPTPLRGAFERAVNYFTEYFPGQQLEVSLEQLWAHTEAVVVGSPKHMRQVYERIVHKDGNGSLAAYWLDYIQLEKWFKDWINARKLFKRAVQFVSDWPAQIENEWLLLERLCGTVDDLTEAERLITEQQSKRQAAALAEYRISVEQAAESKAAKAKAKGKPKPRERANGVSNDSTAEPLSTQQRKGDKRKRDAESGDTMQKKRRTDSISESSSGPRDDKTTVFVKNVSQEADEGTLRQHFSQFGEVVGIRLLLDKATGKHRGIAYVDYADEVQANDAATRAHHSSLNGQPLYCDRGKGTAVKPETKNWVHVNNLAFQVASSDLLDLFSTCVKQSDPKPEVHIVTRDSGESKGFAFVRMPSEESVELALKLTDTELKGRRVKVTRSDREYKPKAPPPPVVSRPKTHLFVPRNLKLASTGAAVSTESPVPEPVASTAADGKKSNADFRKLFLKGANL
eukprot:GILJ01005935.1.p1 GENE.GILJ01005935.1~~GILJ01005935.1.p1  ORF type:complete len:783 (-),score=159.38 GILJ01005935.1:255-2543(-)